MPDPDHPLPAAKGEPELRLSELTAMYQKGEFVFYAQAGVCRVADIGPLDGVPDARAVPYYTLEVVGEQGRVFVPVDTAAYLRPVLTYEETQALLREIPALSVDLSGQSLRQWEDRYRAMVKSHSCRELARLLKTVQRRQTVLERRGRRLGGMDERYRKRAQRLLFTELAVALGITPEGAGALVGERLQPAGKGLQSGGTVVY